MYSCVYIYIYLRFHVFTFIYLYLHLFIYTYIYPRCNLLQQNKSVVLRHQVRGRVKPSCVKSRIGIKMNRSLPDLKVMNRFTSVCLFAKLLRKTLTR